MMKTALFLYSFLFIFTAFPSGARDYVRVVGSSTVFPFATVAAENFGHYSPFKTPVIESTGSGGGIKLFCEGVGLQHPDIVNSSRRIKAKEIKKCTANGIHVTEFSIGTDGVVIANSKQSSQLNLSEKVIFIALAENNGFNKNPASWAEAGKMAGSSVALPNTPIKVLGPPVTSGTRDAFIELVMYQGAKQFAQKFGWDKNALKQNSQQFRKDGAFINTMENDNLTVKKIVGDIQALGIFGFSFLENNLDLIQGVLINGVYPTFDNIALKKYPAARPLFFYVKKNHLNYFGGIIEYIKEFISKKAIGEDGYLIDKGLIPLTEEELNIQIEKLKTLPEITENILLSSSS